VQRESERVGLVTSYFSTFSVFIRIRMGKIPLDASHPAPPPRALLSSFFASSRARRCVLKASALLRKR